MPQLAKPIRDASAWWERLREKTERVGDCLLWTGKIAPNGYSKAIRQEGGKRRSYYVHRIAYVAAHGEPDARLTIDHLCKNRSCVEPSHLEAVTWKENILRGDGPTALHARKTHCAAGHEFTDENTILTKTSAGWGRNCRKCVTRADRERRLSKRIDAAIKLLRENGYEVNLA